MTPNGQFPAGEMDSAYHYPAEVFELLVEAIPCLCKSKPSVLDFFRGAGVPESILAPWRKALTENSEQVKKALISRDVLRQLNEGGERLLAQRREVVKRVSEFEDFSSCWQNDQDRAEVLVNRVRQRVNVRDSFTRMTIEKERTRQEQRERHLAELKVVQQKQEERDSIRRDLYGLFSMSDPHKRGKSLEAVLNRLFASYDMLVRESFTVSARQDGPITEQIDGAIELDGHIYVVEMKWLKERVGTEVGQHAARIMVRPPDVRALYISASGFTEAAIGIARELLGHRLCVLMELQEIIECFERERDLRDVLRSKVSRAQTHKEVFFKLS